MEEMIRLKCEKTGRIHISGHSHLLMCVFVVAVEKN